MPQIKILSLVLGNLLSERRLKNCTSAYKGGPSISRYNPSLAEPVTHNVTHLILRFFFASIMSLNLL